MQPVSSTPALKNATFFTEAANAHFDLRKFPPRAPSRSVVHKEPASREKKNQDKKRELTLRPCSGTLQPANPNLNKPLRPCSGPLRPANPLLNRPLRPGRRFAPVAYDPQIPI